MIDWGHDVRALLAGWSGTQWALRALVVVATAVASAATAAAGSGLATFVVVVTVALATWSFLSPDSSAPAWLILVLVLGWWNRVDDPASGWLLAFATAVLVIHVAAALAAAGSPNASYGSEVVRRWSASTALVTGVAVALWTVLMLLNETSVQASTLRVGVALVAVAALAGLLWRLSVGRAGEPDPLSRSDRRP